MKSATVFLLVLVCSAAFAVPSAPKKYTRREVLRKASDLALKTAQDMKVNHREVKDYIDDLIDVILKANWRVILEQTLTSGDKLCDIVYDTFQQVESRIGADANKFIRENFEPVMGSVMGELFTYIDEDGHWLIDFFTSWGIPEIIPYLMTALFVQVIFSSEYIVSHRFIDALAVDFPHDSETMRLIFEGFDERVIDEVLDYLYIISDAFYDQSH